MSLLERAAAFLVGGASDTPSQQIADPDIARIVRLSDANKPPNYRREVARALAYLSGNAQSYVIDSLEKQFPETAKYMAPVTLGVYPRIMAERARAFSGEGQKFELDWEDEGDHADMDELWCDVIERCGLVRKLIELDPKADAARRFMVRVTWDDREKIPVITLFAPHYSHVPLSADARDIEDVEELALELTPIRTTAGSSGSPQGQEIRRFERWTRGQNPTFRIVDATGKGAPAEPNPYYGPDGRGAEGESIIPVVSFATVDRDAGYWQLPDQNFITGAETIDTQLTNRHHVLKLNAYGQWKAEKNDSPGAQGGADGWPEKVERGPETIMKAPSGWSLDHVAQDAPLTELGEAILEYARQLTSSASLQPGSVFAESGRQIPSGVALLIERAPLDELRRDRIDLYATSVNKLLNLIRIVWNQHQDSDATRFLGCKPCWTPGTITAPMDPKTQRDLDEQEIRIGILSPVRILMRDKGLSLEEAKQLAADIAAENKSRVAGNLRDMAGSLFPPKPAPAPAQPTEGEAQGSNAPGSQSTTKAGTEIPVTTDVQKTALNGAQVTSMQEIVQAVASGQFPRESAVATLEVAFQLSHADADRIIGSAGKGFTPKPSDSSSSGA